MDYNRLTNDVLALHGDIRFSGICDRTGRIIYGAYREGVTPLLSSEEEQKSNLLALERWRLYDSLAPKMGKIRYTLEDYEKVKTATIPLPDQHLLLVSLEVDSDHDRIINKIIRKILTQYVADFL